MTLKSVTFWKLVCGLLTLYCARLDPAGFITVNVIVYYLLLNHRYERGTPTDAGALSARIATTTTDGVTLKEEEPDTTVTPETELPKVRNHRKHTTNDDGQVPPATEKCTNPTGRNCPTPANHPPAWQANRLQRILYEEMNRAR